MSQSGYATAAALAAALAFLSPLTLARAERDQAESPAQGEQRAADHPSLGPATARATMAAAHRYAEIAASGGWPRIARPLDSDSDDAAVAVLRRRLAIEGYLTQEGEDAAGWDEALADAVSSFQANVGLRRTGTVTEETLRELNIPAAARARALAATAARLAKMHFGFSGRYVDVNIPGASVEAVDRDALQGRYDAIVGGKRDPSPQITARIVAIDVNPAWTVPASIVKKEMLPKLRRNPRRLAYEHIRIFDSRGREINPARLRRLSASRAAHFTFRQDPGPKNALGSLRISMPNGKAVYMHDTPNKRLFDRDYRFLSHGCVRVEGVYDLAAWLLEPNEQNWSEDALRRAVESGRSEKIRLRQPVPVAWVYMTGWATDEGPARFRKDIYALDRGFRAPAPHAGVATR